LRIRRRFLKRSLVLLAGLIALGYLSSLLSIGQCEAVVGKRIASAIGQRNVRVLPRTSTYVEGRLKRAGFVTRRCGENEDCFPWVEMAGLPTLRPCTVAVTWGCVAEPLGGAGGRTTFFCVFGYVVQISEEIDWMA